MINMVIESPEIECQAEAVLRMSKATASSSLAFMDVVLQMQAEVAHDELGDSLLEGEAAVKQAQARAGVELSKQRASELHHAVVNCLQKRYLGNCAVARNCSGRDLIDGRLNALGIGRYKTGTKA